MDPQRRSRTLVVTQHCTFVFLGKSNRTRGPVGVGGGEQCLTYYKNKRPAPGSAFGPKKQRYGVVI